MENSVGWLPDQVVHNRANSSGKGPAHMKNAENRLTINIVGWLFSQPGWDRASSSGKVPAHRHKTKTKKKHENIVCQPSATGPTHLEMGQLI